MNPALGLDGYLPYRLSVASNAVTGLTARAYRDRFGLTVPQWRLICVLAEGGAQTRAQAAARMVMDRPTVSRAATGLIKRGFLDREGGQKLVLSPEGARLFGEVAPLALAYEAALIAGLKPGEVLLLKRLLGRLRTAAEALAGEAELPCRLAG
jgi:DNA-binding MarR family transcriptional regulator